MGPIVSAVTTLHWAIEKLHLYVFGSHFKLLTDCKAIELIGNIPSRNTDQFTESSKTLCMGIEYSY